MGANLTGANLTSADLTGADLTRAWLTTGELWETFLAEVVPALLTAGGMSLFQIIERGAWECHDWTGCPLREAFGAHSLSEVPMLYRPRAEQFLPLFDAKLIPCPRLGDGAVDPDLAT